MGRITQADVVRAAIHQLSKRGGYTADTYFAPKVGSEAEYLEAPGVEVGATCAIGGVESEPILDLLDANRDPGDETADEPEASE